VSALAVLKSTVIRGIYDKYGVRSLYEKDLKSGYFAKLDALVAGGIHDRIAEHTRQKQSQPKNLKSKI